MKTNDLPSLRSINQRIKHNQGVSYMANIVTLFGRAGKAPECKTVGANNTLIAEFSLATSEPPRVKGGEWETTWHWVKCIGKVAEKVQANLRKGSEVALVGKIEINQWIDTDGNKKARSYIFVRFQPDIVI